MCSDSRSQLLFLFHEKRPAKTQFQLHPFSTDTRPEKIQTPPDRSATPYYVESFRFSAWVHGMNIQNIESIVLNLDLKPIFWIDCRQHEQCSSYFMKTNITLWSMFNYPGEYVQLPSGVFSTTLGSMFNYPRGYFQLLWGVCSTTLWSIFSYLGEYFQLPWKVLSTTLGTMFNYTGEYVQLP